MKIKQLHIYGFGQIEDTKIVLPQKSFQVFLGKNEAGKSTIMAFIRSILFGFPTKQQNERRFEPKSGGKYGGKIKIETKSYGIVEIERIAGKATGDVTIRFEDGTEGGEEALQLLFKGMDRSLFQAIFSFDIHGLQGIESLGTDEINRYILSAGMTGNESIVLTEKYLDQKLKDLYKPTGRKPEINQQLNALQEKEKELFHWEEKMGSYKELATEKENIEKMLQEIDFNKLKLREEIKIVQVKEQIYPLVFEKRRWEILLNKLPKVRTFPEEGLEKLNTLQMNIQPLEAQYKSLNNKLEKMMQELDSLEVFEKILSFKADINELAAKKEIYDLRRQEYHSLKSQLNETDSEITAVIQKLGASFNPKVIQEIDINVLIKNKLNELIKRENSLDHERQYLDEEFKRLTFTIDETELRMKELESEILSSNKRQELESTIKQVSQIDTKLLEETYIKNKKHERKLTRKIMQYQIIFMINTFLFLIGAGWFGFSQSWINFGVIVILLSLVGIFIWYGILRDYKGDYHDLVKEQKQLLTNIKENKQQNTSFDIVEIEKKLLKDDQVCQQINMEKVSYRQKEESLNNLLQQSEKLELQRFKLEQEKTGLSLKLNVSDNLKGEFLLEVFDLIEEAQKKIMQKKHTYNQFVETKGFLEYFDSNVNIIYEKCTNMKVNGSLERLESLINYLYKEEEKARLKKQLTEIRKELRSQIDGLVQEIKHYKQEIEQLFKLADVVDEEAYRQNAKVWKEKHDIVEKLALLDSQIDASLRVDYKHLPEQIGREGTIDYSEELTELERNVIELDKKRSTYQSELSDLKVKMEQLEEGGTFSNTLHDYQSQKNGLHQSVRQWAVLQIANDLLQKTKGHYRKEKLPKVIIQAQEYFSFMTDKKYVKIISSHTNGKIFVESSEGIIFEPKELSQATTEQLYLAFRLALASIYESKLVYPILIDDSFVNFDYERLERVIKLIRIVSKKHQILFFTCHDYITRYIKSDEIINLESTK